MNFNFSIIIIGYNTLSHLKNLLHSIKKLNTQNINVEVIYIDDGSEDKSFEYFNSYKFPFQKKSFKLQMNRGRVYATQKGIESASGDWLLKIQSNMIVDCNLLQHYTKGINDNNHLIFTGPILYQCEDLVFEKYLNNKTRGINQYQNYNSVHYSHLLFGNTLMHKSVFDQIGLNLELTSYGGEDLEFASQVTQKLPNKIIACKDAKIFRIQHPTLIEHCSRLEEYGAHNFILLSPKLKKQIIKFPILLSNIPGLSVFINCLYFTGLKIYKVPFFSNTITKIILGCAILRGYYSRTK